MAIHDLGHEAVSLTGSQAGIVTDDNHTKAKIVEVRPHRIHEALDAGAIVLVAGFQGVSTVDHDVTTLGRGGSDTTAVALAAALGADACEIFTDVAGVFTADPRIVPQALKLGSVTYEEMLEMSRIGRQGDGAAVDRGRPQLRCEGARPVDVRRRRRAPGSARRTTELLEKAIISGVTHDTSEAKIVLVGVPDQPGRRGARLPEPRGCRRERRHDRPERRRSTERRASRSRSRRRTSRSPTRSSTGRCGCRRRSDRARRRDRQGLADRRRHEEPPRRRGGRCSTRSRRRGSTSRSSRRRRSGSPASSAQPMSSARVQRGSRALPELRRGARRCLRSASSGRPAQSAR